MDPVASRKINVIRESRKEKWMKSQMNLRQRKIQDKLQEASRRCSRGCLSRDSTKLRKESKSNSWMGLSLKQKIWEEMSQWRASSGKWGSAISASSSNLLTLISKLTKRLSGKLSMMKSKDTHLKSWMDINWKSITLRGFKRTKRSLAMRSLPSP